MPIDKLTPRQLDSDADNKTISKVSMLDALNLYSGPDNDSLTILEGKLTKSDAGNGILKNIKGNKKVEGALPEGSRVIGGVEDKKTRITYIFVYNSNASNQGVFAYDSEGLLPGSTEPTLRKIYTSPQFNFPQNGFVKADIVYSAAVRTFKNLGEDFEKDAIIYFTDGVNEPRKINAYRAFEAGDSIHGNDEFAEADFITACPKTQLKPITFKFDNEPFLDPEDRRSVNNFERSPGFQFAYQHIYIDGMESAISSYSEVAIPFSIVDQGSQTHVNHPNYRCLLTIPSSGPEIEKVRILGRQGNTGSFLVIDEINSSEIAQEYAFFNDRVLKGVSTDEVNKQFDSLPRKAKSQSVTSNRLMYGNYLDGFDKSNTTATAQVNYLERPQDFLNFNIDYIPSSSHGNDANEGAAFFLDFSQIPNFLPSETQVAISFTFKPDRNFHLYHPKGAGQSRQRGPQPIDPAPDQIFSGVNFEQSNAVSSGDNGVEEYNGNITQSGKIWGQSFGPNSPLPSGVGSLLNRWKRFHNPQINQGIDDPDSNFTTNFDSYFPQQTQSCRYGTSASNPFIFHGKTIEFSTVLKTTTDIVDAQTRIKNAVTECFTNTNLSENQALEGDSSGITVVSNQAQSSYSFDLGLSSGGLIAQNYIGEGEGDSPHQNSDKIIAVFGGDSTEHTGVPTGFFIVNKATPTFELAELENTYNSPSSVAHFKFFLRSFDNAEVLTCLHETAVSSDDQISLSWLLIDSAEVEQLNSTFDGVLDWIGANYGEQFAGTFQGFGNVPDETSATVNPFSASYNGYGNQVGKIDLSGGGAILGDSMASFILMDGEGGPGGGPARDKELGDHPYDNNKMYLQGSVTVNPKVSEFGFAYVDTVFYSGQVGSGLNGATILPFLKRTGGANENEFEYEIPQGEDGENSLLTPTSVNFKQNQSIVELFEKNVTITLPNGVGFGHESFKTEANHDFGIVYYDERGRHGFVDHLTSAFVEGYTDQERDLNKGRVEIELTLVGEPPEWAHSYKIVYAKNSSVQDFVQYTAGGAFTIQDADDATFSETNKNIYVSLNYLQNHPVSYVSSFGARTPEGGLNFYKFEEGDQLIVISYGSSSSRTYVNYKFDVVDLVDLGDDKNPLSPSPVPSNKKGQFVILKNNPNAEGFKFESILDNSGSKWDENCVIELRTPKKTQSVDEQIYYEVSDHYKVLKNPNGTLQHEEAIVTVDKGDVWFRRVATNVRDFENGEYQDIIINDDGENNADNGPQPNFTSVYMETKSASDLFRSDSLSTGRPNVIFEDASETIRENTITYSDPSNPESTRLRYSSFNASLANFKDLSETFGGIQYMGDHGDFVVVIQRDNVSLVPVGKNILSDASGNQQLIASRNVLNEAVVYPGRSGCDVDPSSVFDSGTEVFFANKNLGEVYRWSKNTGPQVISDIGVSSVLRAIFKKAVELNLNTVSPNDSRIVGGWDPFKKEYLLSVVDVESKLTVGVVLADQPNAETIAPDDGVGGGGGDTNAPSGLTVLQTAIEFGELEVGKSETSVVNILNNDTDFINITSITSSNPTYDVGNMVFPIMLFGADSGVLNEFNLTVNALALEEGDQNGTLEINTDNLDQPRITLSITGSAVAANPPPVENLLPFTVAYNEHNNTSLNDEDMSVDLAIEYITSKTVETEPVENHLKSSQIRHLIDLGNSTSMDYFKADINADGFVGTEDLLLLLAKNGSFSELGGIIDYNQSVLSPVTVLPESKALANKPKPPLTNEFKSPQDAVNFIIANQQLTVGQYLQLRSFLRQDVALNMTQSGAVAALDLIEFLQVFGQQTENSEFAFLPSNQGGIPIGGTQNAIDWLIADGTMTIGVYFQLAELIRPECKADSNQNNSMATADLIAFLSVFGGAFYGEEGYGPNDPAFQF